MSIWNPGFSGASCVLFGSPPYSCQTDELTCCSTLVSSCLHQFLRSSPSCPLSTWYSAAASWKASCGLWNSASVSLESSSMLWMGLATCVPCLISGLLSQFLFIFSILPPETGVLPWVPGKRCVRREWRRLSFQCLGLQSLGCRQGIQKTQTKNVEGK